MPELETKSAAGFSIEAGWSLLESDPAAAEHGATALLRADKRNAAAALLLGAARRRRGNVAGARDVLQRLVDSRAADGNAWHEWGLTLAAMGDDAAAIAAFGRAAAMQPNRRETWRALGDLHMVAGDAPAAGAAYIRAACAGVTDARLARPVAALRAGAFADAAASLSAHLRQVPDDVAARHLLAEATLRLGRADDARAALEHCLAQAPDFAAARHSLAMMLYANGRYADAIPHLARLLDRAPDEYGLRALLAGALVHLGDDAGAIPIYEAMLAESRGQPHVWLFYGHALKAVGREREAVTAYRACLELYPTATGAYLSLADVKTASFTDAELDAMAALLRRPGLDGEDRARLHYALGAALERKASYADSFAHYAAGARLRRKGITYDPARTSAEVARMRALFTADFLARHAATGCPSAAPIFVLGMARAGSTLVEQILASHPAVEGTMELAEIGRIAADLRGPDETYAARLRTADAAMLRRLGERYIAQTLQVRRLGRPHFIDKMPANVMHIGLIHLILPRARIIDVRRRPMAAGFAVFKQYFQHGQDGQDYSYDLAEIGRYYRDYVALTAHFDEVLPGRVHLVRYEALVTDTETEVRRMLDYCGLPFDPACLRFWETARAVQTPSAQQVRQPIFRDALEQWRHYAPWLGPLRDALGPLADA